MTILYKHLGTPSIQFAGAFFGRPQFIEYLPDHEYPTFYALNYDFDSGRLLEDLTDFTWSMGLVNVPPGDWSMGVGLVLQTDLAAESPRLHSLSHVGGFVRIGRVQATSTEGKYVLNEPLVDTVLQPTEGPNGVVEFQVLLEPGESLAVTRHIDQDTLTTASLSWLRTATVRGTLSEPPVEQPEAYRPLPAPITPESDLTEMIQAQIMHAFASAGLDAPQFPDLPPDDDEDDPELELDEPYPDPFDSALSDDSPLLDVAEEPIEAPIEPNGSVDDPDPPVVTDEPDAS